MKVEILHMKKFYPMVRKLHLFGGERGIRTLGTPKGSTVFETAPIDHSGISPEYNSFTNQSGHYFLNQSANIQFQIIPDCLKSR
jgi:hypothetical protein